MGPVTNYGVTLQSISSIYNDDLSVCDSCFVVLLKWVI